MIDEVLSIIRQGLSCRYAVLLGLEPGQDRAVPTRLFVGVPVWLGYAQALCELDWDGGWAKGHVGHL